MTIDRSVYATHELLGVQRGVPVETPVFWRRWFPNIVNSTREYIEFSKIWGRKRLAPLVVPTAEGRPIYGAEEDIDQFKPAYIKPRDPVNPNHVLRRKAGLGELGQIQALDPNQRYDAIIADILREHRETIERRWEWMGAMALLNGKVTLSGESYPETEVDFRRAANHTITLAGTARWGQAGVDVVANLESWNIRMSKAKFGGAATDVIMGPGAWDVFRLNERVLQLLDTQIRNTDAASMDLGMRPGTDESFRGTLSGLSFWVYDGDYEAEDGTATDYMHEDDLLMIGNNVRGTRAFGAILDKGAEFQPLAMFPKMWEENDPPSTVVMTQSAPLMIPQNPNNTLRARIK